MIKKRVTHKRDTDDEEESFVIELPLGKCTATFDLEKAVCNHGFFMMAPNIWIPSTKTLRRPLRIPVDDQNKAAPSVTVSISHSPNNASLRIAVHHADLGSLSTSQRHSILTQVGRMLRISERNERDVREFQSKHSEAKLNNFGRLFRSPTLFEDVVKSILLCNCTWSRTLDMAEALCKLQAALSYHVGDGTVSKTLQPQGSDHRHDEISESKLVSTKSRKRRRTHRKTCTSLGMAIEEDFCRAQLPGNFPCPKEIALLDEDALQRCCNLGYRARSIMKLARSIESGKFSLEDFEEAFLAGSHDSSTAVITYEKSYEKLKQVKGLGPFACANIFMCIGYYRKIPSDTETVRHLREKHGMKNCNKKTVKDDALQLYSDYAPFQCLSYWFELCQYYESKHGKLSELPSSGYRCVTGSIDVRRQSQ